MIQTVLAISTVVIAVSYLGYQIYKKLFKKDTSCDGCAIGAQVSDKS